MNKRELAAILRESIYAPNVPGPLKVMVDVGDSTYYRQRALELITLSLKSPTVDQCDYYLTQAITLLAVAKYVIRDNFDPDIKIKKLSFEIGDKEKLPSFKKIEKLLTEGIMKKEEERLAKQKVNPHKGDIVITTVPKRIPGDPY